MAEQTQGDQEQLKTGQTAQSSAESHGTPSQAEGDRGSGSGPSTENDAVDRSGRDNVGESEGDTSQQNVPATPSQAEG